MDNIRDLLVTQNLANEVKVIDVTTLFGKDVAAKFEIPEVPCLIIGNRYYFRDDILFKENLKEVFKKNG